MCEPKGFVKEPVYYWDHIDDGKVLYEKRKERLPIMGWNSWNAFGSGNTEQLTKEMADALLRLGLDKVGYRYVILDDGCYKPERVDGLLSNEEIKFPSGFRALADHLHGMGLKFGMYNDIGERLCAGAWVGTCGHEYEDAKTYLAWDVDFLKVDNCYNLFDNATFSDPENARYVYAPNIQSITVTGEGFSESYFASADGIVTGSCAKKTDSCVTGIGTLDGTGPSYSPVGCLSSELQFPVTVPKSGSYSVKITYASGKEEGIGSWLQVAVGEDSPLYFNDFLEETAGPEDFKESQEILVEFAEGENILRLMNHRRQENTLGAYGTLVKAFHELAPEKDLILSICEWGKSQPHNWGYKVGDSWRILNDITFDVGSDGDPGQGKWYSDYTDSVISQYNKAVIMDRFAGLNKGWNDPDMLMIGMNGMTEVMNKTHMTMWCMMNAPLMLGLDLRSVEKGDAIWNIIANEEMIALNQDALGIPARRIYSSLETDQPDLTYIREIDRVDILAKPLSDGSIAISFINVSEKEQKGCFETGIDTIVRALADRIADPKVLTDAGSFRVRDLWSKEEWTTDKKCFGVSCLSPCDSITLLVKANG